MKADHYKVRIDRNTGEFWLTLEKPRQPVKRIRNITHDVLLSLCADLFAENGVTKVERDIKFADGGVVRMTIEDLNCEIKVPEAVPKDQDNGR